MTTRKDHKSPAAKKKPKPSIPAALWGVLILLALVPLPLGSNRPLPETLIVIFTAAIGVLWAVGQKRRAAKRGDPRPLELPLPKLAASLFLAVLAFVLIQAAMPLPAPFANPIWFEAGHRLGYISVDPSTSLNRLPLFASYGLLCLIVALLARHFDRLQLLTRGILVIGGLYLVAAFINFSVFPIFSFLGDFAIDSPVPAAPFRNRNSFATFSGMIATGGLVLMIWTLLRGQPTSVGTREILADAIAHKSMPALIGVALFTGGMTMVLLTQSRAGFAATMIAIFVTVLLIPLRTPANHRNPLLENKKHFPALRLFSILAIVVSGTIGLLAFSGAGLEMRLNETPDDARTLLYSHTVRMIEQRPVLGSGYDTYAENFMVSRTAAEEELGDFIDQAHSTYLELASELGLPATLALLLAQGLLIFRCIGAARKGGRAAIPAAIAVVWSVLLGLHTAVDFSAEMPAIAVFYVVMLGMGQGSVEILKRRA